MKKTLFYSMLAFAGLAYTSCIVPQSAAQQTAQRPQQTTQQTGNQNSGQQNGLGDLLGGILNSGAAAADQGGSGWGILGNILASVTGDLTTTQSNLIGTWSYYEPCVQFESESLLKKAGGAAAATKMEEKLVSVYQMIGITPGKVTFTFSNDGNMSYTIGGRTMNGTYVFDSKAKTISIKTTSGLSITSYVTISGRNMSLCFDSSKVLSLFSAAGSLGGVSSTLGTIGSIAQSYNGMKTGFKFRK